MAYPEVFCSRAMYVWYGRIQDLTGGREQIITEMCKIAIVTCRKHEAKRQVC